MRVRLSSLAEVSGQMRAISSSRVHNRPGRSDSATSNAMTLGSMRQADCLPLMRNAPGSTSAPFM